MANSDRDIRIIPDRGSSTDPVIYFTGADSLSSATITLRVYNSGTDATLSFEGDVGQLFSITDSTFGPVFAVNDVTGIPSIEVYDTGEIRFAQYNGYLNVAGTANATSTNTGVVRIAGGTGIAKDLYVGGNINVGGTITASSVSGTVTNSTNVTITNDPSNAAIMYPTFVSATSGNQAIRTDSSGLVWIPSSNKLGLGTASPFSNLQVGSNTFSGSNGMFSDTRVGISNHGALTGLMLASTYNDATYPEYGLVFVQGPSTASYNVWSLSPDGPAKGSGLNFIYGANSTNIHVTAPRVYFRGSDGAVGIGSSAPLTKLHIEETGSDIVGGNAIKSSTMKGITINNTLNDNSSVGIWFGTGPGSHWSGISGQRTNSAANWGTDLRFYTHEDATNDLTYSRERLRISSNGLVGVGTSDFSYTTSDNTAVVAGGITANRLFVNGSIQLNGANDAIVFGRGTSSFFKDEEIGFGWGGGWFMTDATYLRSRNNKHIYNEAPYSGSRFQNFSTSYNAPNLYMPRWEDTNFAFGMSSNDSSTYWMQAKYNGAGNNDRGFRVLDAASGVARMSVADKVTTHQNTFYRTWQSYSGSDNGPMKTWDGVLTAGSDYSGAQAVTIIDTTVPQDSYMMGGFSIEWFENYSSTNAKTTITLGGYWNAESNGGFVGWEYTSTNPSIVPTIRIARNVSTGNTSFILTHFNSSYPIILARDLWLGYSTGSYDYGSGWTIKQQADTTGYTNIDPVVARVAAAASGLNADTLDGIDSTGFWIKSGSWWGSGFSGSRLQGVSANGGEFVLIQDHPNVGQVSVLTDGAYIAGEGNGFWMTPGNAWGTRYGMYWDGTSINFNQGTPPVTMSRIILPQNPTGQAHAGVATQPTYYIGQTNGGDDAWKIYGESPGGTNTGALILQSEDDFDGNESIRLRFKRTYGAYNTTDSLIAYYNYVYAVDMRAPIFYDNDNTAYYGDFGADRSTNINGFSARTVEAAKGTYKYNTPRWAHTGDTNYWVGTMGWGNTDYNSMMDWGSGFTDSWSSPANAPGDTSHYLGAQSVHYSNGSNRYGWQLSGGVTDSFWWRHVWGGGFSSWYKIAMYDNNDNAVRALYASIYYDSNNTVYYADPASTSNFAGLTVANRITGSVSGYATRIDDAQRTAFTVGGNASTFYPVVLQIGAGSTVQQYGEFMIERGGYDDPGYTGVNFSTFNLRMSVKASGWGFGATYENCEALYQNVQLVANWQQVSESSRLIIWLRGATIYNLYNIVGNTTVFNANAAGGNIIETNPAYYTYTFTPTTTIQPKAQHSKYFNNGAMFDGNCRIYSLGLGTNASGTQGEIRATNEITAYYSDRRLKTNVQPIENAVDKVKKLTGITYTGNEIAGENGYDISKRQAGVFADEVENVLPEIVRPAPFDIDDDGDSKSGEYYKTVQYEKLVPLLIEAIKEQQQIIEKQGQRIDDLEDRINKSKLI
jgi:hypothetical protein